VQKQPEPRITLHLMVSHLENRMTTGVHYCQKYHQ
jgi:hypothetical protein